MDFREYFQSYSDYFWEWENEGFSADTVFETLAIPGGNTIAYERFVMETLELLTPDGFPPFGSLLLALIATNPNGDESIVRAFDIINSSKTVVKEEEYPKAFTYAYKFLITLAGLPPDFKEGNKRKILLQAVFKNCHNRLAVGRAKAIMQHYKDHKHQLVECAKKQPFSQASLLKDIKTLAHLHVKFPAPDTLLAEIAKVPALPELNEKISEKQPESATAAGFVNELINHPKTHPVGSLIHRIWGGLNIPLHHSAPSHQPLGGVSDLTNKGDFDKLLISEFANEDEVFISRIANNEALYIKREVPPESDKFLRLLLADCSLKNWGTPKILAFASALAIAKHPKTDIECKIFALGNGYKEVAADTVIDVIEALNSLGSGLDAAPALQAVLDEHTDVKHSEVFLITTEEALASPGMQCTLSDNYEKVKYIITADTDGHINFYRIQNRGRKQIQHIYLPLDELWAQKPKQPRKGGGKQSPKGDTAPTINYPILLPLPAKRRAVFMLNKDEFYVLTGAGAFYKTQVVVPDHNNYFRFHKGGELLLQNLSVTAGGWYALAQTTDGEYLLAAFYKNEMLVSLLNLNTREYHKTKVTLKGNPAGYKIIDSDGFYLFNTDEDACYGIYFHGNELSVVPEEKKADLEYEYTEAKKKTDRFESGLMNYNALSDFLPTCITKENKLQFNKYRLYVSNSANHGYINLMQDRNYVPAIEAAYEKGQNKFTFPDGSTIYRDNLRVITFTSSDPGIPPFYMPTTIDTQIAMATDAFYAGSTNFYNDDAGQEIISVEYFEKKFIKPFIETILNHGV